MPYILIEGYECERCGYRWAPRNGTGYRDEVDPRTCARCKTPYWNVQRKIKRDPERRAARFEPRVKESAAVA